MTDDLVERLRNPTYYTHPTTEDGKLAADRIEKAEAERDEAYASGYSDAETEISKSALGQKNDFLHAQYVNAADRIKQLTADFALQVQRTDEQREAYEQALSVMEADNARLREVVLEADKLLCGDFTGLQWKRECRSFLVWARAVLKGESHN